MSDAIPSLPELPTVVCPHCGTVVPAGHFCGRCGAHLTHPGGAQAQARRAHAYAAAPDEPILRLSVVTSLFPHLSRRSLAPFRIAVGTIGLLLLVLAVAGLEVPLVAVSALGIPLLFQLYVHETGHYGDDALVASLVTLGLGGGLGVAWAELGGPYVARALLPALSASLTSTESLLAATVVPIVGQLLMLAPLAVMVPRRSRHPESLDGFVIAASGALGFTFAATIVDLAGRLPGGILAHEPVTATLAEAAIRGLGVPLVGALATGIVGAAAWTRRSARSSAGGRWLTSPLVALAVALAVDVGLGFADLARLGDLALIAVHLGAIATFVVAARVGLHHLLLHEDHDFAVGPPVVCPSCHHIRPAMPFCPQCGVATHATAKAHRRHELARIGAGEP